MSDAPNQQRTAIIIAAHGRHYLAEADGVKLQCVTRGKKTNVAVGDIVHITMTSPDQGVIDKIEELQAKAHNASLMLHFPPWYGADKALASLELFAAGVMPKFRREPRAQKSA